mmetsp:Transcript_621/g.2126  ORF Transcript_621/g.2126 Transcript_621/m.2126 type:complete len:307 (-) Transcript_621:545-1465(-)|eukprot:scaffold298260_cov32-Tisochrysis_lutea.AAC.1
MRGTLQSNYPLTQLPGVRRKSAEPPSAWSTSATSDCGSKPMTSFRATTSRTRTSIGAPALCGNIVRKHAAPHVILAGAKAKLIIARAASPFESGRDQICWHSSTCGRYHAIARPENKEMASSTHETTAHTVREKRRAIAAEASAMTPIVASAVIHATATSWGMDHGDIHQLSRGSKGGQLLQTTVPCTPRGSWLMAITSSLEYVSKSEGGIDSKREPIRSGAAITAHIENWACTCAGVSEAGASGFEPSSMSGSLKLPGDTCSASFSLVRIATYTLAHSSQSGAMRHELASVAPIGAYHAFQPHSE